MNNKYIIKRAKGEETVTPQDLELIGQYTTEISGGVSVSGYTGRFTVNGGSLQLNFVDGLLKDIEQFS